MYATPGEGVEVRIRIPVRRQFLRPVELAPTPDLDEVVPARDKAPITILIADDHTMVRGALARLMSEIDGLEVVAECANGREAVEQVLCLHPAVVIMDVNMQVMDGIEATRLIKAQSRDINVIGLSVYSDAEGGAQMRAAGADVYLSKTASPKVPIEQVFGLLDKEEGGN